MSDTAIVMPEIKTTIKHSVTTHPKQTSYSAWAKAGLVFGTSVGAFALAKVTGALSWASGLFGSNNNADVHDGAVVAQKEAGMLAVGRDVSIVDTYDVRAVNNNGVGAVAFDELQFMSTGINARRSVDPVFTNNAINIELGKAKVLTTSDLLVNDIDTTDANLRFSISNIQHGHFEKQGSTTTSFYQQDVIDGKISFIHDGSTVAPTYSVTVSDGTAIVGPQRATVTFWDDFIFLNQFNVTDHTSVVPRAFQDMTPLSDGRFAAAMIECPAGTGTSCSGAQWDLYIQILFPNGTISYSKKVATMTTDRFRGYRIKQVEPNKFMFTYVDLWDGPVHGTMYGGFLNLDTSSLAISDIGVAGAQYDVDIVSIAPVGPVGSRFYAAVYTVNVLGSATDPYLQIFDTTNAKYINKCISVQNSNLEGYTYIVPIDTTAFLTLYLNMASSNVITGRRFNYAGVAIDANEFSILTAGTWQYFKVAPLMGSNTGRYVMLWTDSSMMSTGRIYNAASGVDGYSNVFQVGSSGCMWYSVSALQNGGFVVLYRDADGYVYSQKFDANANKYENAMSTGATSTGLYAQYVTGLANGGYVTAHGDGNMPYAKVYGYNAAPRISTNGITINQNETLTLSASNFNVVEDAAQYDSVQYTISNVQNGQFEKTASPGVAIATFTQQEIGAGQVKFIANGGAIAPAMDVAVSDNILSTSSISVGVTFNLSPTITPVLKSVNKNTIMAFNSTDFTSHFSDADGGSLTKIKITDLPAYGTLKSGGSSVAVNQEILIANLGDLTYEPGSWIGQTSFSWKGYDGKMYSLVTSSVDLTSLNVVPTLTSTGSTMNYTEDAGALIIDSNIVIADDDTSMNGAIISIKNNYISGEDYLRFANQNNITGNFDVGTGVLTLSGSANKAQYQTALRSIQYENISQNPSVLQRTIGFVVNDGVDNSNELSRHVTVISVNDTPTISSTGSTLSYTENNGAVAIDNTITIVDVDNTNINNATVTIKTNYANGEDFLRFSTQNGITGNFNAVTGVLTLSGSATVAQYQTALQNVQYENTSENPAIATRTIGFIVNDGTANSNELTRQITVARLNDAPTINPVPKSGAKNVAITFNQADFTSKFSDVDGDSLTKIQIMSLPANGTLKLNTTPVNINDEILVANLAQLNFVPINNWAGATSFSWKGFDGTTYSAAAANVNIAIGNTAPTVTAIAKTGAEDGTVTFTATDFTSKFSDVDGDSLTKIQITSLPTNGTLKLNGLTVAINDEITVANLSNLTFEPSQYWHGATSFSWKGHDGVEYSANTATVDFTISHINHKPTINAVPKSANEDTVITFSSTDFSSKFTDVDSATSGDSLTKIQILSLPNYGTLKLNGIVVIANQEILANELNTLTFEPNANWNGQTSFNWKGYDGYVYSDANTVQLNILSINDAPTIGAIVKTGDQDSMLKFTDLDFINHFSDVDGDTLKQVQIIDLPNHGKLKLNGASVTINQQIPISDVSGLTFEPDSGWSGETNFAWKGYDGQTYSTASASINLVVNKKAEAKSSIGGIAGAIGGAAGGVATVGGVLYGLYKWRKHINERNENYAFAETLRKLLAFEAAKGFEQESVDASGIGATYLQLIRSFLQELRKDTFDMTQLNFKKGENGYKFTQTLANEIKRLAGTSGINIQNLEDILEKPTFIQFALKEYTTAVTGISATATATATTQPTPVIFSSKSGSGTKSPSPVNSVASNNSDSASNDDVESSAGAGIELKKKQSNG